MARRRTLRPEEEELWQAVARTATPLRPHTLFERGALVPSVPAFPDQSPGRPVIPPQKAGPFRIGEKADRTRGHDLAPSLTERLASAPLRMDAKAFARMTRGKLAPEGRIDLHGMTLAEAHPALIRFVLAAQADGMRLVLIITGKGKRGDDDGPIPRRPGVLRHQVPHWLHQPPLGMAVLQVVPAHARHGGSGALYVYLRR